MGGSSTDTAPCQPVDAPEAQLTHLLVERSRLLAVLGQMGQGVLLEDPERRVLWTNAALCRMLGVETAPDSLVGTDARELAGKALTASGQGVLAVWRMDELVAQDRPVLSEAIEMAGGRVLARDYQPLVVDGLRQGTLWVYHDITDQQQLQQRLQWQAMHDPLTQLPNRLLLNDRMGAAMARARRLQHMLAVCMLDLDLFKAINDTYGHDVGDELLTEVARRLLQCTRADDTVARLGGDEFVLLLGGLSNVDEMDAMLTRVHDAIVRPYQLSCGELTLSASIGVALFPLNDNDPDTLLRHADQAMYQAKQAGGHTYSLFDVEVSQQTQHLLRERARVREAIAAGEMRLHFQPKVDMRRGVLVGAEALVRWARPGHGLVYPDRFLPAIDNDSAIENLGEWLVAEVLRLQAGWLAQGIELPVSVNIAARHFLAPHFVDRLQALLQAQPSVPPTLLEIELVESAALHNLDVAAQTIRHTRALGVSVAIDDFGAGYASLGYLRRLPVDVVKIDKSFVIDMLGDADDLEVVQAVIGLARTFRRQVVAEGVESAVHGLLLMRLGCDLAQGYGIARPMAPEDWPAWVRAYTPEPVWAQWADVVWDLEDLPLLTAPALLQDARRRVSEPGGATALLRAMASEPAYGVLERWCLEVGVARYGHLPEWQDLSEACHHLRTLVQCVDADWPDGREPGNPAPDAIELQQALARLETGVQGVQRTVSGQYQALFLVG